MRVICLTNGAHATTKAFLSHSKIEALVERVITVAEVRRWKPPADIYLHAAAKTGVPADRLALVAAHAWDCHGAQKREPLLEQKTNGSRHAGAGQPEPRQFPFVPFSQRVRRHVNLLGLRRLDRFPDPKPPQAQGRETYLRIR